MPDLFGAYEILDTLGQGGMGTVYKARDPRLDRVVALKVLNPDIASPENYERFRREVRVLTKLRHPNIVRLLTAGVEQDRVYFTTEYIEGQPLTDLIAGVRTAQGREALIRALATVARAVHYAHEQRIIHRDLKPSNIIVEKGVGDLSDRVPAPLFHGNPIITDFGLARETESGHTITAPGAAVGTALYMSPEQAEGDASKIGPASDIYALGCMLHEILTGHAPFTGETAAAILGKKVRERPPSPREANASISHDLETICLKCLARSGRDRYPTAEGLAIDLERAVAGEPIFAKPPLAHRLPRFIRDRPTHCAVFAGAGVLLIAVVLTYALRRPGRNGSAPSQPAAISNGDAQSTSPPPSEDSPRLRASVVTYHSPMQRIECIAASGSEVWWGNIAGAVRYDVATGGTWFFPIQWGVKEIAYAGDGTWWLATNRNGLRRYDGKRLTSYAEEDGLPGSRVQHLVIDAQGHPWVAGYRAKGYFVSTFDGRRWTTYRRENGLPGDGLSAIAIDPECLPWVVTITHDRSNPHNGTDKPPRRREGVSHFDGRTWTTYTTRDGLLAGKVKHMRIGPDGRVWIGTEAGLSCFDGKSWKTYTENNGLPYNDVRSLATDAQGRAWVVVSRVVQRKGLKPRWQYRLVRIGGESCTTISADISKGWRRAVVDRKGRLWAMGSGGLNRFDGQTWTTVTKRNGLPYESVGGLVIDPHDRLWVVTHDASTKLSGVSYLQGTTWVSCFPEGGLLADHVKDIKIDRSGRVWAITDGGVSRFDGKTWKTYTYRNGLFGGEVTGFSEDAQGRVWVASYGYGDRYGQAGLTLLNGDRFRRFTEADGLPGRNVVCVACDPHGRTWAVTRKGIASFDGDAWTTYTDKDGFPSSFVRAIASRGASIALDRQGQPWVATSQGVARFDGTAWSVCTQELGRVIAEKIVFDLQGRPWIVYDDGPERGSWIAFFDKDKWTPFKCQRRVRAIVFDRQGRTWTGTDKGGVACFDGTRWTAYGKKHGLPSGSVRAIAVDPEGRVWAGTPRGLSCFDGTSWRTFTQDDGLAGNTVESLAVDHDGGIWVGTVTGLSHIVPKEKAD